MVTYGGPDIGEYHYDPKDAKGRCAKCPKKNTCTHINSHTIDCNDDIYSYQRWGSS